MTRPLYVGRRESARHGPPIRGPLALRRDVREHGLFTSGTIHPPLPVQRGILHPPTGGIRLLDGAAPPIAGKSALTDER
jgi:hypothetical protein